MSPRGLLLSAVVASGCFSLKSANDIADQSVIIPDGGVDMVQGCWDPTGFGGKGCFKCTPSTREELINSCTPASCMAYDNTALGLGDGGLPAPPTLDFALPPPPDLSSTDLASPSPMPDMAVAPPIACASLTGGNVIYAAGSSAVTLFLGAIAQALENGTTPLTIVYQSQGSCTGVNAIVTPATAKMTGTAIYWDPNLAVDPTTTAAQLKCTLDPGGIVADIGFSDVFATTCLSLPGGLDPSIKDFFGPIQVMNFVVPQNSVAQNISAEAAFLVYGFGALQHVVTPWSDGNFILQRNGSSGTQGMIAQTIGLAATNWYGKVHSSSGPLRDDLIAAGSLGQDPANKSIGILSSDVYDPVRANLHGLAFQDKGQRCAFYPDSALAAKDKINVRDGHYAIFGPLHMLTHVSANGTPINPNSPTVLNAISGVAPPAGVDIIDSYAKHSVIPLCAMRVTRDSDGGEIRAFIPAKGCGCYYTDRATSISPPTGCTTCNTGSDCPPATPNCNKFAAQTKGYCEP